MCISDWQLHGGSVLLGIGMRGCASRYVLRWPLLLGPMALLRVVDCLFFVYLLSRAGKVGLMIVFMIVIVIG